MIRYPKPKLRNEKLKFKLLSLIILGVNHYQFKQTDTKRYKKDTVHAYMYTYLYVCIHSKPAYI